MAKKVLFSMFLGAFVIIVAGLASAEAPVLTFQEQQMHSKQDLQPGVQGSSPILTDDDLQMQARQPSADPESQYSNSGTWQERGPVETGSVPAMQGDSSGLRCCAGDSGWVLDQAGDTVLRHGIDDGP